MSETAGACVYDGVPLEGVRVRIAPPGVATATTSDPRGATATTSHAGGRIVLGGVTPAKGYRTPPDPDPFAEPGWFRTDDLGVVDDSGVLSVLGRVDDAISTGGVTVVAQVLVG